MVAMSKPTDFQVMVNLLEQVAKAVPKGGALRDVTTWITRPMWEAFQRAFLGKPPRTVGGSQTVIVESAAWRSVSLVMKPKLGPQKPCPPEPTM